MNCVISFEETVLNMPAIFQTKNLIDTQSPHASKPVFALDQVAAGKKILDLESQPQVPPAGNPSKTNTCLTITLISFVAVLLMLIFTLIAIELVDMDVRSCNQEQPLDEFVIIHEIDPDFVSLPNSRSSYNQALTSGAISQEALI